MEFFSGLILVVVAFAAGIFAGKIVAPNAARIKALEEQLSEQKQEHQTYKDSVAEHFSTSANLFGDITEKYRNLYDHMSSGAYGLCDRRSIPRDLTASHVNILAVETPVVSPKLNNEGDPLRTHTSSADDYMVDVARSGMAHLDPKSQQLNQQNRSEKEITTKVAPEAEAESESEAESNETETTATKTNSAEIIDLESQRLDDAQQAKDYAIKAKGVINHNSLNRDEAE